MEGAMSNLVLLEQRVRRLELGAGGGGGFAIGSPGAGNINGLSYASGVLRAHLATASFPGMLGASDFARLAMLVGTPANGLGLDGSGLLTLATATTASAGAMSAEDKRTLSALPALSVFPTNGVDDTAAVVSRAADAVALGRPGIHFGDGNWTFNCGGRTDDSWLVDLRAYPGF